MYEENRRFNWTNFFIKGIIVIIFILFTVWLLSLSNKGINNKLDVLTDNIFSQNIDKMKEVGKSYFTTERLPQKVGEVKTLTLAKMYDENYILELKDKDGHACSAKNSYVSIEKMENEYQMKVYLECGEESDYIVVIMGCYDYCDTDICEKKEEKEEVKPVVNPTTNTYTEYEYKKVIEGYWTEYGSWSEWSKVSVTNTDYRQVETKTVSEESSHDIKVTDTRYADLILSCPDTYKLSNGKCVKQIKTTTTTKPNACPSTYNGYTLVSQNGLICNYKTTKPATSSPVCDPKYGNGTYSSISNFTCYYKESTSSCSQVASQVLVPKYCGSIICGQYYETTYTTVCSPSTKTTSKSAYCKSGYTNINGICTLTEKTNIQSETTCPSGYSKVNNTCSLTKESTDVKDVVKSCPTGYSKTSDGIRCYQDYERVETVIKVKNVTYYRYRLREYVSQKIDIKWSRSNNDKSLLNAGYKLTGNTKKVSSK